VRFLYYYSTQFPFSKISTKTALPSMTQTQLRSLSILLPPLSEQKAIANYLDEKCSKIDKAIELVEKQIDAYKRLKRSLINEVVTGKRRVA
jgi:type I restriction enzyme S subunit